MKAQALTAAFVSLVAVGACAPDSGVPRDVIGTESGGRISISWAAVHDAVSYNLYWSEDGNPFASGAKVSGVTSPWEHQVALEGRTYSYSVTAVQPAGEGVPSEPIEVSKPWLTAPTVPSNLYASPSPGAITVFWSEVPSAQSYNLYWSIDGEPPVTVGQRIEGVRSPFRHEGRSNGVPVAYVVTAVNPAGESAASSSVVAIPKVSMQSCVSPIAPVSGTYTGALSQVALGTGAGAIQEGALDTCVTFTPPSPPSGGASQEFALTFITEASTLRQRLGVSAGGAFEAGFFKTEASARFVSSQQVDSSSAFLLLDVKVRFPAQSISTAALTDQASALLTSDPESFIAQCGDQFVASVTRGGLFRAIYRFSGLSTRSKQQLETSLKASSTNWSVDGAFETELERARARYETELYVLQEGGQLSQVPLTVQELLERARTFGAGLTFDTATPITVETRSYYTATNRLPESRLPASGEQLAVLEALVPKYEQARVLAQDLRARMLRPGRLDDLQCEAEKAKLTTKLQEVEAFLIAAANKVEACKIQPACGATPECLADLATPALTFPALEDLSCGPRCGAGSTYTFDRFGYCTRCTFTNLQADVMEHDSGVSGTRTGLMASECKYLRRGANVRVRVSGQVFNDYPTSDQRFYAWASALSAPESIDTCSVGQPCGLFYAGSSGTAASPVGFDLTTSITVGSAQPDQAVRGSLTSAACLSSAGSSTLCKYRAVTIDLCDTDASDCL